MKWLRLFSSAWLGLLIACGDDDGERKPVADDACIVDMDECDVEETTCLESLLDLTLSAREEHGHADLPPVQRITTAEFVERLRAEKAEHGATTSPWDLVLPKLSLIPAGKPTSEAAVDVLADSVLAFYDDASHDITLITDTEVKEPQDAMYVVMHELTHFLQGRDHDFAALKKHASTSTDDRAALTALIEGEATVTSTRALVWLMHRAPETLDWERYFDALDESLFKSIKDSEAPLISALQALPYGVGGRYIEQLWEGGDRSDVDGLFDMWPHTLQEWLKGPWEDDGVAELALSCAPPLPPDGFKVFEVDSFGVAGALALLAAAGSGDFELAKELTDDAFAVYLTEADAGAPESAKSAIGVWRMRFSGGATKYLKAIASLKLDAEPVGDELVIRVASDAASGNAFTDAGAGMCPKLDELKPMRAEPSLPSAIRRIVQSERRW